MNFVEQVLVEHREELGLRAVGLDGALQTTLLTPRFPTSRHVVALVFAGGRRAPAAVVKIPRNPLDTGGIEREAEMLRRLSALAGPGRLHVPAILGLISCHGQPMLVESVVEGQRLDRRLVQRDLRGALTLGTSFIAALPNTRAAADNADWYTDTVARPLARLAEVAPLDGETEELRARTDELLEPLRSLPLPAFFEHGDLADPNLLLHPGGTRLGVIDWERASANGVPGHDLIFFLQFLSECATSSNWSPAAHAMAFDDAFIGSDAWAVPVLRDHLRSRQVDDALWGRLVLASWARTASTLSSRFLHEDAIDARHSSSVLDAAVASEREFRLWRHALAAAERGNLGF